MSSSSSSSRSSGPVRISYPTLLADPASLLTSIAQAFGSEEGCLGIILIEGESGGSDVLDLSFRCTSLVWLLLAPIRVSRVQPPTPTPSSRLPSRALQLVAPMSELSTAHLTIASTSPHALHHSGPILIDLQPFHPFHQSSQSDRPQSPPLLVALALNPR